MIRTVKFQTALFFEGILPRPDQIFFQINQDFSNLFNGVPTILPIPPDAPLDIPLVQLKSESNLYQLNISKSRADLFMNPLQAESYNDKLALDFVTLSKLFISVFSKLCNINRIGYVILTHKESNSPSKLISEKYFKPNFKDSDELSFRRNINRRVKGILINDILELASSELTNPSVGTKKGVLIIRDLNNKEVSVMKKEEIESLLEDFLKSTSLNLIEKIVDNG